LNREILGAKVDEKAVYIFLSLEIANSFSPV
jgi:hypothetical protein